MNLVGPSTMRCALNAILVMAVSGALVFGCSGQRSEQYRQQGDTYLRLHKFAEAEDAYRKAREADPENTAASLGLGRCLFAAGKPDEALTIFRDTITQTPQNELAYWEAAYLYLGMGNAAGAEEITQPLGTINPKLGAILHAYILSRTGRLEDAIAELSKLKEQHPDSPLVLAHLAGVQFMKGDSGQAEKTLEGIASFKSDECVDAQMLLVEILASQGKLDPILNHQQVLPGENPEPEMVLAHALILGGRVDEAESLIQAKFRQDKNAGWASFVLGNRLLDKGQYREAASLLRTAALISPWAWTIMRDLGKAETGISEAVAKTGDVNAKNENAHPTLAQSAESDWQALWRQGALRKLIEERDRFQQQGGENLPETLTLAALFLGERALAGELSSGLPADAPLRAFMKALQENKPQEAVEALRPWNDKGEALLILSMNATGYAMAVNGARGQAVQVLSACSERFPTNGVSLLNVAQVFRAANMPQFAARALGKLTAAFPENVEAHGLLCRVLRESGLRAEARQAAEVMYALFPDSKDANLAVCGIYMDGKELDQAMQVASHYLESHPEDTEMLLTKAMLLLRKAETNEALKILNNIPQVPEFVSAIASMTAISRGLLYDWRGTIDASVSSGADAMPLSMRFILAAAYIKEAQKDKAAGILKPSETEEPSGGRMGAIAIDACGLSGLTLSEREKALANALSSNVELLADFTAGAAYQVALLYDDAYQAFKRIDDAISPENTLLLDVLYMNLANCSRIPDLRDEALSLATKHVSSANAWLGYASILQKAGNTEAEREALQKANEIAPENPQVIMRRGDFFARQKDDKAAAEEYRRVVALRPDEPVANNNLAYYLLMNNGNLDEALNFARVALKGLPRDPHVLHTLGVALLRKGDLEESKKNLIAALQLLPGDPSLLLDYGKLLIALGDVEAGRRHIGSALANSRILGLDFDRQAEAEALLIPDKAP